MAPLYEFFNNENKLARSIGSLEAWCSAVLRVATRLILTASLVKTSLQTCHRAAQQAIVLQSTLISVVGRTECFVTLCRLVQIAPTVGIPCRIYRCCFQQLRAAYPRCTFSMSASLSKSALLACLEQLDDDIWSCVLLPKLVADKSASAVCLTCSRLRQLSQTNKMRLDLSLVASRDTQYLAAVPSHFHSCTTVLMALRDDSSYVLAPAIAQAASG